MRSEDGGATWRQCYTRENADGTASSIGLETPCLHEIVPDRERIGRFFLCYYDIGLLVTEDNGATCRQAVRGIRHPDSNNCFGVAQAEDERNNLTVATLEKCYVLSAAKAKEEDGIWKEACKAELVKLQQGDADNLALWKKFIDISIGEFERMYRKLGVKFDTYRGESYYNDTMPGVVEKLQKMGLAVESEGALVVNLEEEKLGVAIVRKSDGGYNYTTSDLACVKTRVEEYDPERIIYVTDARQQLHFKQWFNIAGKMGYTTKLVHVPFGLMSYQGKAISTREGNLIKLDELLAEAKRRAFEIVKDRGGDERLAEQIGYGAVKYSDLSHDPITDIDFSWDKALALEGNSGPYLQYAYARVCSLMEKAGVEVSAPRGEGAAGTVLGTARPSCRPWHRGHLRQLLRAQLH